MTFLSELIVIMYIFEYTVLALAVIGTILLATLALEIVSLIKSIFQKKQKEKST